MRRWVYIFAFLSCVVGLCQFQVSGERLVYANRKWFEFNRTLYRIEVEAESKWKDASKQCRKEQLSLLRADPQFHPRELRDFIQNKFSNFSSFWVQNNATNLNFMQKLAFKKGGKGQMCNKMDNMTFDIGAQECSHHLGFICERQLKQDYSKHRIKDQEYYIEPHTKYSCEEAQSQCSKENMTLLPVAVYEDNFLLRDYIYLNYGSTPTFWLGTTNTSAQCLARDERLSVPDGSSHGYICVKLVMRLLLTFRQLVLIGCISAAVVIAIIVCVVMKCCLRRGKTEEIMPTGHRGRM